MSSCQALTSKPGVGHSGTEGSIHILKSERSHKMMQSEFSAVNLLLAVAIYANRCPS